MFCLTCRKRSIEGWIRLYGEYSVICNICTEKYNQNSDIKIGVMIRCGHFFCTICLDNWLVNTWSNLNSNLEPLNDYIDDPRVFNTAIFDQDMISNLFLPLRDANIINYNHYDRNVLMRLIFSFATYLNQESLVDIIHLIEHYYHQEVTNIRQMSHLPPPRTNLSRHHTPTTTPVSVDNINDEENIDVIFRNDSTETLRTLINEYEYEPIINAEIEIPSQIPHETDSNTVTPDTVIPDTVIPDTVIPDTVIPNTVIPDTVIQNDNTRTSVNRRRLRRFRIIYLETHPDIALDCATFVQQLMSNNLGNQTVNQTCLTIERSRIFWIPGFFKNTVPHNRNCAFCNNISKSWIRHINNVIWIPCCRQPINNYWF